MKKPKKKHFLTVLVLFFVIIFLSMKTLSDKALERYEDFASKVVRDRKGEILRVYSNKVGLYTLSITKIPENFTKLLIEKEDRFFYYHPGINPVSLLRISGSSTLTQQLVKVLLGNENSRALSNKLAESFYAVSLEFFKTKDEILLMYLNTAYFGKQAQGLGEGARYYFDKAPEELSEEESFALITALGKPASRYPGTEENTAFTALLSKERAPLLSLAKPENLPRKSAESFELDTIPISCAHACTTTMDKQITEKIREILQRTVNSAGFATAKNAAVVVIKIPENELLSVVGTPDPDSQENGYQINMAVEPRPIGSTIKPFIYLKAFEKGARPYTLVDDREYTYPIGTGFPIYPKNYDGTYRGEVTLHSALVNSLNVPAVKVLEYITPENLYTLLQDNLNFQPIAPLESYDLGIALGALEMDLFTLSHYFTIFPNRGIIKPLTALKSGGITTIKAPMEKEEIRTGRLAPEALTELVTKVISDRETSVDQFGLAGNLNLPYKNYAVKTGTSRDYHDSWTIGYTPDFLVGVWVGNHDNTPMRELSGQSGAGKIWHEVMALMYASEYNHNTEFSFKNLESYVINGNLEYGLPGDDTGQARQELLQGDKTLITNPHEGDVFEYLPKTTIPLRSKEESEWFINDTFIGRGKELSWQPRGVGSHSIEAKSRARTEKVQVRIVTP